MNEKEVKKIHNPVTGNYYSVRKASTQPAKSLWNEPKPDESRLLTKEERDEIYDNADIKTCGDERIAYCKAQDTKTAAILEPQIRADATEEMRRKGYVLLDPNQELPDTFSKTYGEAESARKAQQDMLKARFKKVILKPQPNSVIGVAEL